MEKPIGYEPIIARSNRVGDIYSRIAQLVERMTLTHEVASSSLAAVGIAPWCNGST